MKVRTTGCPPAAAAADAGRRAGMTAWQLVKIQAAVAGGLVVALIAWEIPGIVRELRIWRMTGGLRASRRYP